MTHKMIKGVLTMQYGPGGYEFFLKVAEDKYIEVSFPQGLDQALKVPTNQLVGLCIDKNNVVCTHSEYFKVYDYE